MRRDSNEGNKKKITMMMDSVDKHIVSILFVDISNFNEMLNYFGDHRELVEVKKKYCACVRGREREKHTHKDNAIVLLLKQVRSPPWGFFFFF